MSIEASAFFIEMRLVERRYAAGKCFEALAHPNQLILIIAKLIV